MSESNPRTGVLRIPAYRRLFLAAVAFSLGQWMERTAIGWIVLELTGSVFLTAAAWAVRSLPNLFLGGIAGTVTDRHRRNRVLATIALVRAAIVTTIGLVLLGNVGDVYLMLIVLIVLSGITMTFQLCALQPLAVEAAGIGQIARAVSVISFGQRIVAALGALSSGYLLANVSAGATMLVAAVPLAVSALGFVAVPARAVPETSTRFGTDMLDGLRAVFQVRIVTLLLGLMLVAEILGFSFNSLLPAVAEQLLQIGPLEFGALASSAQVGSVVGTGLLAAVSHRVRQGPFLLGAVMAFGGLIIALSQATVLWVSLVIVAGIGGAAGCIDALEWMLLQASVDARMRGRVLGAWNMAIGWGWIGPIVLGALAERFGVGSALLLSGGLLAAIGLAVSVASPKLRRA